MLKMADIINIREAFTTRKLKPMIERGWLYEREIDGQDCWGITDDGMRIVIAMVSLMFLEGRVWEEPRYHYLTPQQAGVLFGQDILGEPPFDGSPVMFIAVMGDQIIEDFGINTPEQAEHLLEISKQNSEYGKNFDPID